MQATPETKQQTDRVPKNPSPGMRAAFAPFVHVDQGTASYDIPHPASTAEQDEGILGPLHLNRVLRVVRRKARVILLTLVLAAAAAAYYLHRATPVYRATALVEMSLRRPRIMNQQGAIIEDSRPMPSDEVFHTRLRKFKGKAMVEQAVTQFLAHQDTHSLTEAEARHILNSGISFDLIGNTRLVRITADKEDPTIAAAAANAFAMAAEISAIEENRRISDNAVAWLQSQAQTRRAALQQAEEALIEFRVENQIDVLENQRESVQQALLALGQSQVAIEREQVLMRDMVETLRASEVEPEAIGRLPESIPRGEEANRAFEEWSAAVAELSAMRTRFREKHPTFLAKKQDIRNLRQQVVDAVRRSRETAESQLALLERQRQSLGKEIAELNRKATDLERKVVERRGRLNALEREREACDITFRGILGRIQEARLAADEETATVKVLERADAPAQPISPHVPRVWTLALLLGLAAGIVLAMGADRLEDLITSVADIEQGLGLKLMGLIPHVPKADRKTLAMTSLKDRFSHVTEAFAGVRSMVDSPQYRKQSQAILIASTAPGEGKTISASNLAIASAKSGCRTLLIDLDLRHPRLGRLYDMPANQPSLLHVLNAWDTSWFVRLPFPGPCEGLDVMSSLPDDELSPAEVLSTQRASELISWARNRYDRIVIDSPPLGLVSDTAVLAQWVDAIIMVCRPGVSRRKATCHAVRHFAEVGGNVIGVIVNDVDFRRNAYFSNYDYHYTHYPMRYQYGSAGYSSKSSRTST